MKAASLAPSLQALADLDIRRFRLGEHRLEDFLAADVIVANPGMKPHHPLLVAARKQGICVTSEIALTLAACQAQVIAVTGSNGKSTTTALIAAALASGGKTAIAGGNIGRSLLPDLAALGTEDWVVLELSSFQLEHLAAELATREPADWPRTWRVAVLTGFSPNHLDWHGSLAAYRQAKQQVLVLQEAADSLAVLNLDATEMELWRPCLRGRVVPLAADGEVPPLRLLGKMNRANAQCAMTVANALGIPHAASARTVAAFAGLPHRLQWVASIAGRNCYNDSAATTPESVLAALDSFESGTWLLMGGVTKGRDLSSSFPQVLRRAGGVAFYGKAAGELFPAAQTACLRFIPAGRRHKAMFKVCYEI